LRELLHDEPREPEDTVHALAIAVAHADRRPQAVRAARRCGYSWGKLAEATGVAISTLRGWETVQ
jgi:hypothetical protein